ncbi:Os04g0336901 [Oryza sativa Japonica Group]|uniref:Os04g0336901 protein n=1 Tax=Oryza sativa subsp. japonica TaxID=39947 RepID=A0A0P0W8R3_ORYSJ|nr:Os04g0336970 [Oryza sativa Japonica Group]BAS88641.1 Os04g0336901 [Oryza sativa Japonica Group]
MPSVLDKGCTAQEFENAWVAFVNHYGLQDENEYLQNAQKIIDDESDQNDSWETDADKLTDVKIRVDPPKLLVQAHGDQSEDQVNPAPLKACKDCKPSVN